MKAYTNYPLEDNPGSMVVEIDVLSYDRNKYCIVSHNGLEDEIRRGYIWKDAKLTKRFADIHWKLLPYYPTDARPTRLQARQELKRTYGFKVVIYILSTDSKDKRYTKLSDALKSFSSYKGDCCLFKQTVNGVEWGGSILLEREGGFVYRPLRSGRRSIKTRHFKKYKINIYKKN